jgi:hypothetical protein
MTTGDLCGASAYPVHRPQGSWRYTGRRPPAAWGHNRGSPSSYRSVEAEVLPSAGRRVFVFGGPLRLEDGPGPTWRSAASSRSRVRAVKTLSRRRPSSRARITMFRMSRTKRCESRARVIPGPLHAMVAGHQGAARRGLAPRIAACSPSLGRVPTRTAATMAVWTMKQV